MLEWSDIVWRNMIFYKWNLSNALSFYWQTISSLMRTYEHALKFLIHWYDCAHRIIPLQHCSCVTIGTIQNVSTMSVSNRLGEIHSISIFYSTPVIRGYKIVSASLNHEDCARCIGMFKTFVFRGNSGIYIYILQYKNYSRFKNP